MGDWELQQQKMAQFKVRRWTHQPKPYFCKKLFAKANKETSRVLSKSGTEVLLQGAIRAQLSHYDLSTKQGCGAHSESTPE